MGILTRAALEALAAKPTDVKTVSIPEFGGDICIRVMTSGERGAWERSCIKKIGSDGKAEPDLADQREKLLVRALCDETGKRLFLDHEFPQIRGLDSRGVDKLFEEVRQFNKLSKNAVEEAEKNSETSQPSDSSSG